MKKRALHKDFYREVKKTRNRFLSILVIVALGVAFFSGVRVSNPDMVLSADKFYDENRLMDIRVLGTLGVTDEDVQVISQVEGVETVEPGYSVDMLGDVGEHQLALQVMSMPWELNQITLKEGRFPQKEGECLADSRLLEIGLLQVGDTITLKSDSEEETKDLIRETEYVVVGAGVSPLYLSLDRGTTKVGSGSLDGFLLLPAKSFAMDCYTQICVAAQGARELESYTEAYDNLVDELVERIEALEEEQCQLRYAQIQQEGAEKIAEGEEEIAEGEEKLADARKELADGEKKLADAEEELADARKELADGEATLTEKEKELSDARAELDDGWRQLTEAKEKLVEGTRKIEGAYKDYEAGAARLREGRTQWEAGQAEYEKNETQLSKLKQQKEQLEGILQAQQLSDEELAALGLPRLTQEEQAAYEEQLISLIAGITQLEAALPEAKKQLEAAKAELLAGEQQLAEGKALLDQYNAQIEQGGSEAIYAERDLEEAEKEWAEGNEKILDAREELADGKRRLAEAEEELLRAREELSEGQQEYQEAADENEPKIADAKEKIADAKKELSELEQPEWYVLDRQYLQTYVEYGQDAERIGAIGEWFPAIFFLVAALVCLTTMTRMVEEERTQIGTLKALGYSNHSIAAKYILYALLSSVVGSVVGVLVGERILPLVIINAYRILYTNLPQVLTPLDVNYSMTSSLLAILCTTVAALAACYKELFSVPAALMRPVAPKAGKRVFLERLPFLWRRLNFSYKATVRNLMRYKKRFFMTIFGIGGCMALLLVGFGIKDSILYIGTVQFGEICTYDISFGVEEDAKREEQEGLFARISGDGRMLSAMWVREASLDVEAGGVIKSGYLVVPEQPGELKDYIHLRNRSRQEAFPLTDKGVIITEKLAKLLDVKSGDRIWLKEDETRQVEVEVSGIAENYFLHYVYMSPRVYEELYGEAPVYNAIYGNTVSQDEKLEEELRRDYTKREAISNVTFVSTMAQRVTDMLKSMDTIIYVLVIAAGLLAFVVLYNLNNINVSERKRELATLKVLGFFDGEVSAYVNRENVLLTLFGAAAGVILGRFLHRFIIVTAEIDMLMFGREIAGMSYVYSVLLTFLFSFIVNAVMHFKLKKIDMVESMKSVE
ncbi:MAG: FtsX-like permease family protein [Lachnospiraceae bacterium]|nr:FtsX-like permease family protein [Lachnospiraceae bacterium]